MKAVVDFILIDAIIDQVVRLLWESYQSFLSGYFQDNYRVANANHAALNLNQRTIIKCGSRILHLIDT